MVWKAKGESETATARAMSSATFLPWTHYEVRLAVRLTIRQKAGVLSTTDST